MNLTSEKIYVLMTRLADGAGNLLFLKLITNIASKDAVGTYLLASSFVALILTVSFSAIDQGLLRNASSYKDGGNLKANFSALSVVYFVLAAAICFSLVLISIETSLLSDVDDVLVLTLIWLIFEAQKNLNLSTASALRSRATILGATILDYSVRFLAIQWYIANKVIAASDIVTCLVLASFLTTGFYLLRHRTHLGRFKLVNMSTSMKEALLFSWPMLIWGFFGWLQNMSSRWLLNHFADIATVAEYGILVAIGTFPVTALVGIIVTYAQPIIYQEEDRSKYSSTAAVLKFAALLLPFCGVMIFVSLVWHKEIVALLTGPLYVSKSGFLPIIMAAVCFSSVCSVLSYAVYAQRRVATLLYANACPGAISLAVGFFLIQDFQFEGALATLVITHFSAGLLFILAYLRVRYVAKVDQQMFTSSA